MEDGLGEAQGQQAGIKEKLSEVTQLHWSQLPFCVAMTNSVFIFIFFTSICFLAVFSRVPNSAVSR